LTYNLKQFNSLTWLTLTRHILRQIYATACKDSDVTKMKTRPAENVAQSRVSNRRQTRITA